MSRIGNQEIKIEDGINIEVKGDLVTVKGPKGELSQEIQKGITVEVKEGVLKVTRKSDDKKTRAMHGLIRSLIANMIQGVKEGFETNLELIGIGYRVALSGQNLQLSLGFSHPVIVEPPEGISFEVPSETEIKITGIDKQKVGEVAAKIRAFRKPEPYKGKGIRYKDEHVPIKQPKAMTTEE